MWTGSSLARGRVTAADDVRRRRGELLHDGIVAVLLDHMLQACHLMTRVNPKPVRTAASLRVVDGSGRQDGVAAQIAALADDLRLARRVAVAGSLGSMSLVELVFLQCHFSSPSPRPIGSSGKRVSRARR